MTFTLRLPGGIPLLWIIGGAWVLLVFQILSGTGLVFAELIFLFVVLAGLGVNALGGLRTVAGFCLAMMALKVVVVSQVAKVLFWEPADHNLRQPWLTAGVLVVGMSSILLAALACRVVGRRRVLFQPDIDLDYLRRATWIAFGIFLIASPGYLLMGTGEGYVQIGGISGLLKRLTPCGGLAVVAGTAHTIVSSQGRRCLSRLNLPPMVLMFLFGLYSASKEGMLAPFVCFVLTAAAFRFRVGPAYLLGALGFALCLQFVLFPFGQVARSRIRGHGFSDTLAELSSFGAENFSSWARLQELYQRSDDGLEDAGANLYFDRPIGALERVSLIKPCDALVTATLELGESKWETIVPGFESLMPASIFRRSYKNTANSLGVKSGMIPEENEGTSVSFGVIADAFSAFGWVGTAVIPFLVYFLFFAVTRLLTGPMEQNIWWAFFCGLYHHQVAEFNISGIFTLTFYQNLWYVAPALFVHFSARWAGGHGLSRRLSWVQ